jgi:hypothetical protein
MSQLCKSYGGAYHRPGVLFAEAGGVIRFPPFFFLLYLSLMSIVSIRTITIGL